MSPDCILHILSFSSRKDITSISLSNKKMHNLIKKNNYIIWKAFCNEYQLLKQKDTSKFTVSTYKEIIDTTVTESFGAHHAADSAYWNYVNAPKKYSWFPTAKKCLGLWWYNYKWKINFTKIGTYKVWLRIKSHKNIRVQNSYNISYIINHILYNKFIPSSIFNGEKCWKDICIAVINIIIPQDVTFSIDHNSVIHTHNEYHTYHQYAFSYYHPVSENELDAKDIEVIILDE